ncbi:MAG TPA: helix-turn-helix domain-containing protein [Deltaproteobacteria bacterium]|nr:helix-turn-helix domain-containing protein [Deltaproteobacteria bacterium]
MSRPLRIQYPDAWYHVMNRGRRGEVIFKTDGDCEAFIDILNELVDVYHVHVAAYCLMSNLYHLLIQTPNANLSRAMRHLNGVYTQCFNRSHSCDGQLFRGRYKSIVVDADRYLLELVRYIHRNPLEAGLVETLNTYKWSSHKGYLSNARKWDWLHKDFILSLFSKNRPESIRLYKQFVSRATAEEINQLFGRMTLPAVLGSAEFVDTLKEMYFIHTNLEEVPGSRYRAPDVVTIKAEVCRFFKVDGRDLSTSRRGKFNEPRNIAIYLTRHLRCDPLKEIGTSFDIEKYSTVSSVIERVKEEIQKDKNFKKRVDDLRAILTRGQR